MSFNSATFTGRVTGPVKLGKTKTGISVANFGLAVNSFTEDEPLFIEVTVWERRAETADKYLSKGVPVLVQGRIRLDTWETGETKRSRIALTADRMEMLGGRTAIGGNETGEIRD